MVNYWLSSQDKQVVEEGGYGWRGGYGGGTSYDYKEGTLIVDLIKPAGQRLVWRATIVAPLEDSTQENIDLGNKAIAEAFEEYPPKNAS
jgi:hypothetical protein